METKKIINLIILDASGSMSTIYNQALGGVNETLGAIRVAQNEHPELKQYVTLASFSAGEKYLNKIFTDKPIDEVRNITKEDYPLLGCTALHDAMGDMITEVMGSATTDDYVLVTVITDGYENASQKWTAAGVKSLVETLKTKGWTFTYIGANQDVVMVAESLGVKNSLCFEASEEGTKQMFEKDKKSRKAFFNKLSFNVANDIETSFEDEDYFQ